VVECTKVLIVDQELGAYEAIKQGLRRHGYELHTTTAIPHALALAGAHQYQVALVDFPLVCNTTFFAELRTELPDLSVILLLPSHNAPHIPTQVLEMAVNVIGKPLTLEPCHLILDRTLELATLRSQVRQHRRLWSVMFASSPASAKAPGEDTATFVSLDAVLTTKLRHMVPHFEVLGRGTLHRALLSHVEKLLLTAVLTECRGNQVRAADILGINRNTLRKKIREFDIAILREGGAE
jgi:DNA-binding NtrC family response regulator